MIGYGAWIKCDDCPTIAGSNNQQFSRFRGVLKAEGWTFIEPGWHFCPECSAKRETGDTDYPLSPQDPNRKYPPSRLKGGTTTGKASTL